jgi:hypothetical protein
MNNEKATRSDLEALTALNRDYIHSVQHGDVQRFEEILAEDFLCSNPDGSLVDKNQFLAQTARPVTISGLAVQDVRVRILGDVAIFMRAQATPRQTASSGMAAIPMSGRVGTEDGSRYPRM